MWGRVMLEIINHFLSGSCDERDYNLCYGEAIAAASSVQALYVYQLASFTLTASSQNITKNWKHFSAAIQSLR